MCPIAQLALGLLPQSLRHLRNPWKSVKVDRPHHVSSVPQETAVPLDLGLTAVRDTHTNPNPAVFVSMFAGININAYYNSHRIQCMAL